MKEKKRRLSIPKFLTRLADEAEGELSQFKETSRGNKTFKQIKRQTAQTKQTTETQLPVFGEQYIL